MTSQQRGRGASLSQSRSTPNLPSLDPNGHSPAITVEAGTPRSPAAVGGLPSPPPSRDGYVRGGSGAYGGGEEGGREGAEDNYEQGDEAEHDADFADFLIGDDDDEEDEDEDSDEEEDEDGEDDGHSSTTSDASSPASSRASGAGGRRRSAMGTLPSAGGGLATMLGRSQSHVQLTSFAPPFYNRPPLPLPPSPSLTSLLRPSFSATPSRPTTPDDSETDTPPTNDTEAAVGQAARAATTVPRAAPRVPTYEYYGFVLYLSSSVVFLVYVLWSYLPSPFLVALGIDYYPNRWWSLAVPAQLVASIVYIYVALACYNTEVLTLPLAHLGCIVDEAAHIAVLDAQGRICRDAEPAWDLVNGTGTGAGAGPQRAADGEKKSKPRRSKSKKDRKDNKGTRKKDGLREHKERDRDAAHRDLHFHRPPKEFLGDWRSAWNEGTDAVMDVPIGGVCEILYGEASDAE